MRTFFTSFLLLVSLVFRTDAAAFDTNPAWEELNNEALTLNQEGSYDRAIVAGKKALRIAEQEKERNPIRIATSLNNLAMIYCNQGRYLIAKPLYKRALEMMKKALGPNHPEVGTILNNLATLYDDQEEFAQAEPLYKRAATIMENALGPEHPEVATLLNNLGAMYRSMGQYEKAEPLLKRSLAIREKAFDLRHPDVAASLENLADLYRKTGRDKEAEALETRIASMYHSPESAPPETEEEILLHGSISISELKSKPSPNSETGNSFPPSPAPVSRPSDSIDLPVLSVGDCYVFDVENVSDSKLNYTLIRTITAIDGSRITVETHNEQYFRKRKTFYDLNLGYLGSESADKDVISFSPPLKYFDFPLTVGKKWTAASVETAQKTGRKRYFTIHGTIEGWEKVKVPAGEFDALKIILKTDIKDGDTVSTGTDISWYVPSLHRSVRTELIGRDAASGKEEKKILRLTSYHIRP